LLLVPGLVALLASPASARQVDDPDTNADVAAAEQKAAQAFEAYQGKRFAEAVALYLEAYKAAPSADVLYNVARIYDAKLGDRPLAISFYRRYIADPGAVTDRIQIANERLVTLREAELAASRAPEPGPLAPAPRAAPDARADSSSFSGDAGWRPAEVTGVILGITGVVALGVGTGYGIAAMRETETVRDVCPNNVCSAQRGIDAADSASDHATVSTIAFASGGALLALGAVCYFWLGDSSDSPRSDRPDSASAAGLRLAIGQRPGGAALELGGAW
jgi:tetratricopeptide (TPR) repeat protein